MIKTFKVRHYLDLDHSLFEKAIKVALFAFEHGYTSTAYVKHIGLKSEIACQIIRKYGRNKKIKQIDFKRVKLTIPGQGIKFDQHTRMFYIRCLKASFRCWFSSDWTKINQVELDETWAYVSVTFPNQPMVESKNFIGIDLNSTSHSIVVADPVTGKVQKLGKQIPFLKKKYQNIRQDLQRSGQHKQLKRVKDRERRKTHDTIHKITTQIVRDAKRRGVGIKIEDLVGIRKRCTKNHHKSGNQTLNSWPFYFVRQSLTYKAKELGVELCVVDPAWTSTTCSRCGYVDKENRHGKVFQCKHCGHVDHADANAAFNIALRPKIDPAEKRICRRGRMAESSQALPELESPRGNSDESTETPKLSVYPVE